MALTRITYLLLAAHEVSQVVDGDMLGGGEERVHVVHQEPVELDLGVELGCQLLS